MENAAVPVDDVQLAEVVKLHAAKGDAAAQVDLGMMHVDGRGVTQDDVRAVELFKMAAHQNNAVARRKLGSMYACGRGVAQHYLRASELFKVAAFQDDAVAQRKLGEMYHHGRGVGQNDQSAVTLFILAAEQGDTVAQGYLGDGYTPSVAQGVAQGEAQRPWRFKPGWHVFIDGVIQRPELNGETGTIRSFDNATGRYGVSISRESRAGGGGVQEEHVSLKQLNLVPIHELPDGVNRAIMTGQLAANPGFDERLSTFFATTRRDGSIMQPTTLLGLASVHAHVPTVEMLLERGAIIDLAGPSRDTPLMVACHGNERHVPVIETLLRHRAAVDLQSRDGITALMYASRRGNAQAITLLLEYGARLDAIQAVHGGTALTHAAYEGSLRGVQCLLQANACTTVRIANGVTALQIAESRGHAACARAIREHESSRRPGTAAVSQQSADTGVDTVPPEPEQWELANAAMASLLAEEEEEVRAKAEATKTSKNAKKKARKRAARAAATAAGEAATCWSELRTASETGRY